MYSPKRSTCWILCFVIALLTNAAVAQKHDYPPPTDVAAVDDEELDATFQKSWELLFDIPFDPEFERLASVIEFTGIQRQDRFLQARGLARRAWADLIMRQRDNGAEKKLDHARELTEAVPTSPEERAAHTVARAEVLLIDGCLKSMFGIRNSETAGEDIEQGLSLSWQAENDLLLCMGHIMATARHSLRDHKLPAMYHALRAEHYAEATQVQSMISFVRRLILGECEHLELRSSADYERLCEDTLARFPEDSVAWQLAEANSMTDEEIQELGEKYLRAARKNELPSDYSEDYMWDLLRYYSAQPDPPAELLQMSDLALARVRGEGKFMNIAYFEVCRARAMVALDQTDGFIDFVTPLYNKLIDNEMYRSALSLTETCVEFCAARSPEDLLEWKKRHAEVRLKNNETILRELTQVAKTAVLQEASTRSARKFEREALLNEAIAVKLQQEADRKLAKERESLAEERTRGIVLTAFATIALLFGIAGIIFVRNRTLSARQSELEAEVKQRIAAEEALREAQLERVRRERLQALGELAAGVAHDVNNCLSPILVYSELMTDDEALTKDPEEIRRLARVINDCVGDASTLVRRLHPFHRKSFIEQAEVDVPSLLEWVAERAKLKTTGRDIQIELDTVPSTFSTSAAELREILMNLTNNAIDAISDSGKIILRNRVEQDHLVLEVEDNGCGMTEEVQKKCLDSFFSTKDDVGSGLGLATTAAIATAHGGQIQIKSKPEVGTTFRVSLPPIDFAAEPAPFIKPEGANNGEALQVLLVDDNSQTLESTRQLLDYLGHEVRTCKATEAIDVLESGHFDVLLTDYKMPEMSGVEICKAARLRFTDLALVIASGFDEPGVSEMCDFFIPKPISARTLRTTLEKIRWNPGPHSRSSA